MTPSQLTALRAAIDSTPAWAAFPNTTDGHIDLAALLNKQAAPDFFVWRTNVPVSQILGAVDQSKYTPQDVISDAVADLAVLTRMQIREIRSQTKLMLFQNYVVGQGIVNCGPGVVRKGLNDAVTKVPAGVNGADVTPGAPVATLFGGLRRLATEAERVLVAPADPGLDTVATVTARVMTWEGNVQASHVAAARALP
jgi:hypothetical protein